jgi:hypothetical protein
LLYPGFQESKAEGGLFPRPMQRRGQSACPIMWITIRDGWKEMKLKFLWCMEKCWHEEELAAAALSRYIGRILMVFKKYWEVNNNYLFIYANILHLAG